MPVRVDVPELIALLSLTPADQNVMLVGRHGIGKSQIIAEHYGSRGMSVVPFFLGQMSDPGDLIGLLHKDTQTGRSEFLPPYWWPADDRPIVLFLDELNRARPEVLQSVMELVLNKTLAGKRLPPGSVIVSAVNEGDEYQLTDLDPALVSRFNVYEFSPTVEDWMLWAKQHNVDERIQSFVATQPSFLDGWTVTDDAHRSLVAPESFSSSSGLTKTPDRRGWARVSRLIEPIERLESLHFKLIAGIVGSAASTAFRKSLTVPLPVSAVQVLLHFDDAKKTLKKLTLAEVLVLNEQVLTWISAGRCPAESADVARESLVKYVKLLRARKLTEAVAHWVSLLDKPVHAPAMTFVTQSLELTELITQFMEGIQLA